MVFVVEVDDTALRSREATKQRIMECRRTAYRQSSAAYNIIRDCREEIV